MNRYPFFVTALLAITLGTTEPLVAQTKVADYTLGGNSFETCAGGLVTSDGGYLTGGSTQSAVSGEVTMPSPAPPSGLNIDFWIVKSDAQGNRLWDKRYGGTDDDRLVKILPASNGGFLLCGWSRSAQGFDITEPSRGLMDYWIVKVNEQGNKQWDKRFGTSGGEILSCAIVTPDGGYLLVGTSGPLSQSVTTPAEGDRTEAVLGYNDIWMVKIDVNGTKQWDKRLGGPGSDIVYDVANASGGGFVLGGLPLVDSGWGGQTPAGDISGTSFGLNDWWIIKTDAQGVKLWDRFYGGTGPDYINALLATPDGGILAAGSSQSPVSGNKAVFMAGKIGWLLKLDSQGNKQWEQVYNSFPVTGACLQSNPAGGYLLGGGLRYNMSATDMDFWLANIDANGLVRWEQLYGGTSAENITGVVPTTSGNILLFGTSNSNNSRDKTANSRGGDDIWVVKVAATVLGAKSQNAALSNTASIYPNPSNQDRVTVEVTGLHEQKSVRLEVINILGQAVQGLNLPVYQGAIRQQLELSAIPDGVYTLRLHTTEGIITKQLIKT
jgi:hypothetical protein